MSRKANSEEKKVRRSGQGVEKWKRGDKIYSPAFLRLFESPNITLSESQEISTFFPPQMYKGFMRAIGEANYIRKGHYILGPLYHDKSGKPADLQIGVTGSAGVGEPLWLSMSREMGEEVGLVPWSRDNLDKLYKGSYNSKIMEVYSIDIRDTIPLRDSQHGIKVTPVPDDKVNKVGCYIYGTKKQILDYMESDRINLYASEDNIIGIGAIKALHIFNMLSAAVPDTTNDSDD